MCRACVRRGWCGGLGVEVPAHGASLPTSMGRCPGRTVVTVVSTVGGAFGFTSGTIVQEFGYDDDVDPALREAAETLTGTELLRDRKSVV